MKCPFKRKSKEKSFIDEAIENRTVVLRSEESALSLDDNEIDEIKSIVEIDEIRTKNLERLVETNEKLKPKHWWNKIDPNTIFIIAGNLVLTLVITKHEDLNIITSKAKQFWINIKPR